MAKEKRLNGEVIGRKFVTMLPLDVVIELENFTRKYSMTGLGKTDYGVALRILLENYNNSKIIDGLIEEIELLKQKVLELQSRPKPVVEEEEKLITFRTKSEGGI